MEKLNSTRILLCTFLSLLLVPMLSVAKTVYPWEKDSVSQQEQQNRQRPATRWKSRKQLRSSFSNRIQLGEFYLSIPEGWMQVPPDFAKQMGGAGVMKITLNGHGASIILSDEEPFHYVDDRKRAGYEKVLAKNVAGGDPNAISYMDIMGDRTVVLRSIDEDDGSTMFYIIPCDGTSCYVIFVVYDQTVKTLPHDVETILSTLEPAH